MRSTLALFPSHTCDHRQADPLTTYSGTNNFIVAACTTLRIAQVLYSWEVQYLSRSLAHICHNKEIRTTTLLFDGLSHCRGLR